MLSNVKVFTSKDNLQSYRGARMERIIVTAIECISASGRYLGSINIWPASTHRANWTTYPTPRWIMHTLNLDIPTLKLA
ncbi:hypothetical protein PSPO01_13573 [Paraphaeosphaeria sporulosa]